MNFTITTELLTTLRNQIAKDYPTLDGSIRLERVMEVAGILYVSEAFPSIKTTPEERVLVATEFMTVGYKDTLVEFMGKYSGEVHATVSIVLNNVDTMGDMANFHKGDLIKHLICGYVSLSGDHTLIDFWAEYRTPEWVKLTDRILQRADIKRFIAKEKLGELINILITSRDHVPSTVAEMRLPNNLEELTSLLEKTPITKEALLGIVRVDSPNELVARAIVAMCGDSIYSEQDIGTIHDLFNDKVTLPEEYPIYAKVEYDDEYYVLHIEYATIPQLRNMVY